MSPDELATIDSWWRAYSRQVLHALSPEELIRARRVFYAGAISCLQVMLRSLEAGGAILHDTAGEEMVRLEVELRRHAEGVVGHPLPPFLITKPD